jgi:uncharacterized protein YaaR (DUF327 family)
MSVVASDLKMRDVNQEEEKKQEKEFAELFGQYSEIVSNLLREEWKRTLDSLREMADNARKNGHRNEETRREAIETLKFVIEKFLGESGKDYDFEVHFNKYLELYDKEFNEMIGNYTHLKHYFGGNGIITEEYIYDLGYDFGEKYTFDRCVRVIKHLYITYRLKTSRGHLMNDIYHIKGETERIESRCGA